MLNKVTAQNFQSWAELEFEIEKGIKLVDGWNEDDQTSEGSGKSAVLNAISWGGFGKIPKDAKVDEVIKDGESGCRVDLHFANGDSIVRSRKPNDLYIRKASGDIVKGKDAKETQELIEEYLGMNFETFCQSVYFAQNYDKKFLPANQEEKGKILSNIQNTSIFDKARKEVMELSKKEDKKVETLRNSIQIEDNNLRNIESQRTLLAKFVQDKINAHVTQVRALREKRDDFYALVQVGKQKVDKAQADFDAVDLSALERDEAELAAVRPQFADQLAAVRYNKSQIDTVSKTILGKESEGKALATKYQTLQAKLQTSRTTESHRLKALRANKEQILNMSANASVIRLETKIKQLEQFIANPTKNCPSCGSELKSLDTSHTQKELDQVIQERADLTKQMLAQAEQIDDQIEAEKREIVAQEATMEAEMQGIVTQLQTVSEYLSANPLPNLDALNAQEAELVKTISGIDAAVRDLQSKKLVKNQLETALKLAAQSLTHNEQSLATAEAEMSKIQDPDLSKESEQEDQLVEAYRQISEKRGHIDTVLQQSLAYLSRLETLKEGFKEIKSYVFNNALKELNLRSNQYLSELFEVEASLKFTNEDQKIESTVTLDGQERGLGLLSGGQNRRFNLAVDLALSDLVSSRKASKMDFLILDEYFKDLSEVSMEKCLDLLKTRTCPVVLIEHNSIFKNIVDNTFFVRLTNGTSSESRP